MATFIFLHFLAASSRSFFLKSLNRDNHLLQIKQTSGPGATMNENGSENAVCPAKYKKTTEIYTSFLNHIGHFKTACMYVTCRSARCSSTSLSGREVCALILGQVKSDAVSPTARQSSDVSSHLCCSCA